MTHHYDSSGTVCGYRSEREEVFNDLMLNVADKTDLEASLKDEYV